MHFCNTLCMYGWFSGLMMGGSCVGIITWSARMQNLVNNFQGNDTSFSLLQRSVFSARGYLWVAVFHVMYVTAFPSMYFCNIMWMYAIEFLCLSVSKLMVLDRMLDFVTSPQLADGSKKWRLGGRVVMAVVVLGSFAGLAGNVAAAVHWMRASDSMGSAHELLSTGSGNSTDADKRFSEAFNHLQDAWRIGAIQTFCEVAVLIVIVVAFSAVGVACAHRIRTTLRGVIGTSGASQAAAAGAQLRRRIVGTCGAVFGAFLLRSLFSTMFAVVNFLQEFGKLCPGKTFCDPTCYSEYTHIATWIARTPQLQLSIVLISSPLALLVALWGMTSYYFIFKNLSCLNNCNHLTLREGGVSSSLTHSTVTRHW